ncbi:RNA 2',3'-cyclic phosphodiesterase [Pseudomonas stutzeri]|uniref:RNA 2',3'-cyclic phosphodiesterase n=1 Tax=Stutzerimonas stutzeri TaxID=316 RepID=A0A2N8S136_STUST|nr:RNA 2',3'-cyclic phosphodiesterase [Stutzerimonas stutzeri]MCQ4295487.1 RNA 2',3'-cyclic phosphodiesterase [Stutzerimonas stutzeri]PNF80333.1 RNA 2',3'-cyclic phosphodiesterase [Stutzerimonas stutzeri]
MIDDTLRLFFALPCPPEQAAAICAWRDSQDFDGRAVARDNLHLTLAFLGAQPTHHLDALLQMAATVQAEAFSLTLDRLTTIGKGFICLQPGTTPPELLRLVAALSERLAALGVVLDCRPFLPHLTLSRQARSRPQKLAPGFAWQVDRFVLYRSSNVADGVRYDELGSWSLSAP